MEPLIATAIDQCPLCHNWPCLSAIIAGAAAIGAVVTYYVLRLKGYRPNKQ